MNEVTASNSSEFNVSKDIDNFYNAYIIAENVQKYSKPVICLFGFVGNFLAATIFFGKSQRKTSCSLYLGARSLSDMGFLISLFFIWLGDMKVNAFKPPGMCQVIVFLSYVSAFLSVWFVVMVTFENYIRICLHFKVCTYCTTKKATIVICLLMAISFITYSITLWTTTAVITPSGMSMCEPYSEFEDIFQYLIYIDVVVTLVLPTLITIILMIPITFSLVESLRRQARLRGKSGHNEDRRISNPQSKVTKMLFCVSLAFIILSLPSHVVRMQLTISTFVEQKTSPIGLMVSIVKYIFETIYYLSFAINIIIYIIIGDKFRRDLKAKFCMQTLMHKEQSTQTILKLNHVRGINKEEACTLLEKDTCATPV